MAPITVGKGAGELDVLDLVIDFLDIYIVGQDNEIVLHQHLIVRTELIHHD
jgi:hypothetical protein